MNRYRISAIHAEVLERLKDGGSMVYNITTPKALASRIRYKSYLESDPIVQFMLNNGLKLIPDDKEKQGIINLHNTIAIREFINYKNTWRLSLFVKSIFNFMIRIVRDNYDGFLDNSYDIAVKEAQVLSAIDGTGNMSSLNRHLDDEQSIEAFRCCAEQRCKVLKISEGYFKISMDQYLYVDYIFGMSDFFKTARIMDDSKCNDKDVNSADETTEVTDTDSTEKTDVDLSEFITTDILGTKKDFNKIKEKIDEIVKKTDLFLK